MLTDQQAAQYGLLVQYAYDVYEADRGNLAPDPDPRLTPDWTVLGNLTATDCLFRRGQTIVAGAISWYGYLAQSVASPDQFVMVLRGTEGILEWIEDAQFLPKAHPAGGLVEMGFWNLYQSLRYVPLTGVAMPPWVGLSLAVGAGNVTVIGHSLGSTLGTFLAFDLAVTLGDRVSACLFASPRPGDAAFCKAFDARVKSYRLYNYELDVVPRVPFGPAYTDLPRVSWIGVSGAQARIRFDLACHHHVLSYCAMLDYSLFALADSPADSIYAACIRGSTLAAAAGGLAL